MGVSALPTVRILLIALPMIVTFVMVVLAVMWLRKEQEKPAPSERTTLTRQLTMILLGVILVASLMVWWTLPQDDSSERTYSISVGLAASSVGFSIDDFSLSISDPDLAYNTWFNSYANTKNIGDFELNSLVTMNITCSHAPVFWGHVSQSFRVYASYYDVMVVYDNASGGTVALWSNEGYASHSAWTVHFEDGSSWVELELMIVPGPVD